MSDTIRVRVLLERVVGDTPRDRAIHRVNEVIFDYGRVTILDKFGIAHLEDAEMGFMRAQSVLEAHWDSKFAGDVPRMQPNGVAAYEDALIGLYMDWGKDEMIDEIESLVGQRWANAMAAGFIKECEEESEDEE